MQETDCSACTTPRNLGHSELARTRNEVATEAINMDRMKANYKAGILACLLLTAQGANAAWDDWMKKLDETLATPGAADAGATSLSQSEIAAGLKQALSTGVDRATALLGREGGFANDAAVRITLPESLQTVAQGLRSVGQGAIVDEFTASMNRAAEKAVPATTAILVETIRKMSLQDARGILNGPDDAATQYFRKQNEQQLATAILPIVEDATAQTGVTSAYKRMTGGLGMLTQLGGHDSLDLDQYVTRRTLDGLFTKLAAEEKLIREDPVARSTQLLKKVFGAAGQ